MLEFRELVVLNLIYRKPELRAASKARPHWLFLVGLEWWKAGQGCSLSVLPPESCAGTNHIKLCFSAILRFSFVVM